MKKRISSYVILSGLLSCSVVLFGMDSQQSSHPSQEAQKNQLSQGHHHHHHHHLKDIEKKVISDLEKVEDVLHPIVQKGIEELKQEPQVIAAVLNTIGVKQQDAQNITN